MIKEWSLSDTTLDTWLTTVRSFNILICFSINLST